MTDKFELGLKRAERLRNGFERLIEGYELVGGAVIDGLGHVHAGTEKVLERGLDILDEVLDGMDKELDRVRSQQQSVNKPTTAPTTDRDVWNNALYKARRQFNESLRKQAAAAEPETVKSETPTAPRPVQPENVEPTRKEKVDTIRKYLSDRGNTDSIWHGITSDSISSEVVDATYNLLIGAAAYRSNKD